MGDLVDDSNNTTEVDTEDDAEFIASFESEDDAAPAPEVEQPAKPEAEAEPAGEDENDVDDGDVDPDPNADSVPATDADDGDDVADPDEHPQVREWEGRRDKLKAEVEKERAELKRLQEEAAAVKPAEPPQQELPDDVADASSDDELDTLFVDFPEYRDSITKLIDKRVAAATGANTAAIEQQGQTIQEIALSQIEAAHPDFREHVNSGAVMDWIDTLPRKEGNELMRIYEDGTAAQNIELLTRFKQSRQSPETEPPKDDVTITRRARTSAPAPTSRRPRRSDDELFYAEFSKED